MIPKGKSFGNYDWKAVSDMTSTWPREGIAAQQHFAEDADINTIVRRFGLTGQLPQVVTEGVYGDFSGITDFDSAMDTIKRTEDRFMRLPPEFREKFRNDPSELVRYSVEHSEAHLEELFGKPVVVEALPPL